MRILRILPVAAVGLMLVSAAPVRAQLKPSVTNVELKAEPAEVQFTEAYVNQKATAQVSLTNTGDKEIEIVSAKGSCGCTTTGVKKNKLAPGETTTMSVSFKGSRAQAGKEVIKQVTVTTKTGDLDGKLVIPVRANLTAPVMVEPSYVKFDGIERGATVERDIVVEATDGSSFRITDIKVAGEGVTISPMQTEDGLKHTLKLSVTAAEDPERMSRAAKMTLQTTHPKDTQISIPISWRIDQYVDVKPIRLYLGNMTVGEPKTLMLDITPRKREKLESLTFTMDGSPLKLEAKQMPDKDNRWELTFIADESLANKVVRGNVVLDTHVEPEGQIKVPVNGRVKPLDKSASK